jgi:hypothetical protein
MSKFFPDTPFADTIEGLDVSSLAGLKELAETFSVTARQIHAWATRRSGGFPEPVALRSVPAYPGDKVGAPLYAREAVVEWHRTYEPSRGRGAHWRSKRAAETHPTE